MDNKNNKIITFIVGFMKFILKLIKLFVITSIIVAIIYYAIYVAFDCIFKDILPSLSRAVLSNFIVFSLIIFTVLRQSVHPKAILEQVQSKIENDIKDSEIVKDESEKELNIIQESVKNIQFEIDSILEKSNENAKLVSEKVLEDVNNITIAIQENTDKAIESNQLILKNELLRRASLASIEVAKKHIINELSWNQGLHDKLIDESIEALEGINQ
ncbi:hypothetical protein J6R97_02400 [bacterium]|nr:hypothetical protein [bacterium]